MAQLIPGPTGRTFVPDDYDRANHRAQDDLVSQVRVTDKGPDTLLEIHTRGIRSGHLLVLAHDAPTIIGRLFADPPVGGRECAGALMNDLEDAAAAQDVAAVTRTRRALAAFIEQLQAALAGRGVEAIDVPTTYVEWSPDPAAQEDR